MNRNTFDGLPLLLPVPQAANLLGISRASAYRLAATGEYANGYHGRRGIRRVTLQGYSHDLTAVRRFIGSKKLQQLTKADGDALVEWMLTEERSSRKRYRPGGQ